MKDDELFDAWVSARREEGEDVEDGAFTAAVMKRLDDEPRLSPVPEERRTISRPFLASLCFGIGFGKLLLLLHLTF